MPISNKDSLKRANKIAKDLLSTNLSAGDAVWILTTAIDLITYGASKAETPNVDNTRGININLVKRSKGVPRKILKDMELRLFIHNLTTFYSIEKLQRLLVEKFGRTRAPSTATLSKYLKVMSQSTYLNQR